MTAFPPTTDALGDLIPVTPDTVEQATRAYPWTARKAIGLLARLAKGQLDIAMPDGRTMRIVGPQPGPAASMIVRNLAFAQHLTKGADLAMAESFMAGAWDSPDLTRLLELVCVNRDALFGLLAPNPAARVLQLLAHWRNRNSKAGSRRNIFSHYDLGNAFYAAWLDRTMTYSSALFTEGARDLPAAQEEKYRNLIRNAGVAPHHRVLEIGCGWGGFAEFAARTVGCRVTGLTISPAQHAFASRRVFEAGLNEKVEIKLQDYRDERGRYDRIASIEMFEAVGEAYWPRFFAQMRDRLVPDGMAGLQVITIADRFFEGYRREIDFIRKYVFPGGMLPSPSRLLGLGGSHGFKLAAERVFGHDYASTLALWRTRFRAAWPGLQAQGFDERFRRLWEYYLAYCEAGFRTEIIDVRQIVFAKPA